MYWRSLAVRDRRHLTSAEEIRDACFDHLRWAENGGRVRPLITVFAPDTPEVAAPRVYNKQLVAYAGHRLEDGSWLGDAATIPLTELAERLGWSPADRGHFDVLPLLIQTSDGELSAHPLPAEVAGDIAIEHPTIPAPSDLGLRWYKFPTVSDMTLSVGGVSYPFAPFAGWYIAPELSARDFTDFDRYDLLAKIATAFGFDAGEPNVLWKDRTMIELTEAVLWSFARSGVRMDSHHRALLAVPQVRSVPANSRRRGLGRVGVDYPADLGGCHSGLPRHVHVGRGLAELRPQAPGGPPRRLSRGARFRARWDCACSDAGDRRRQRDRVSPNRMVARSAGRCTSLHGTGSSDRHRGAAGPARDHRARRPGPGRS